MRNRNVLSGDGSETTGSGEDNSPLLSLPEPSERGTDLCNRASCERLIPYPLDPLEAVVQVYVVAVEKKKLPTHLWARVAARAKDRPALA